MSEELNHVFIPEGLRFHFGEYGCLSEKEGNFFTCHQEIDEDIECSEIIIKDIADKRIVETIKREIKLSKGDILHFEYQIDVKFG